MPSVASRVSAVNGPDLLRSAPDAGPAVPAVVSHTMDKLYPFSNAYAFFTGTCRYSNPTETGLTTYFASYPGAVQVPEAGTVPVTIRQPPLFLRWSKLGNGSNSAPADGAVVKATPVQPAGQSCVEPPITLYTWTTSLGKGVVGRSKLAANDYVEAGLPFGDYTLCFQTGGKYASYPADWPGSNPPYDNTLATGQPVIKTLDGTLATWRSTPC
jgi:hypothetical protein